jgi:hypothetical protein
MSLFSEAECLEIESEYAFACLPLFITASIKSAYRFTEQLSGSDDRPVFSNTTMTTMVKMQLDQDWRICSKCDKKTEFFVGVDGLVESSWDPNGLRTLLLWTTATTLSHYEWKDKPQ